LLTNIVDDFNSSDIFLIENYSEIFNIFFTDNFFQNPFTIFTIFTFWGISNLPVLPSVSNKEFLHFAQTQGYVLVVTKDPDDGGVRIYSRPDSKVDLTKSYNEVKKLDLQSDWFLHASKKLLLNSASAAKMRPTKLSLEEVIKVLKNGWLFIL